MDVEDFIEMLLDYGFESQAETVKKQFEEQLQNH